MKLADWEGIKDNRWKQQADIEHLKDPVGKRLAGQLNLCYVESKKKIIQLTWYQHYSLFQYWSEVGIADTNEYLCNRKEGEDYTVAWDTLQAV